MTQNPLLKAVFKPHKAFKVILDIKKIGFSPFRLSAYLFELYNDSHFWDYVNRTIQEAKSTFPDSRLGGWMLGYPAIMLYPIVRLTKPQIVVETGVGPGGSSALILHALNRNGKGYLHSIDLPGNDALVYPQIGRCYNIHVPPGYEVGWLVPPWLRGRWNLQLGDSKQVLPPLLKEVGSIDMFLHDSLHTDEHITFELTASFPYLNEGGLLLADDVNEYWSMAFVTFCRSNGVQFIVLGNRLGIARKGI